MKSMVLKDLYNIGHNAKSMLFMLLIFAFIFIPQGTPESYIITSGILCSMMTITTFSFDDMAKWVRYALIMPVSKRDVVLGKYAVLFIFSGIGVVFGLMIGIIGGLLLHKINLGSTIEWLTLLGFTLAGFLIAIFNGGTVIPLLIKFGAEKARILSISVIIIPFGIWYIISSVLKALEITISDQLIGILLCALPFFVIAWTFVMYKLANRIFEKQEV